MSEAVAAMKADGIEYDERMERHDEVTWPKPLQELLDQGRRQVLLHPTEHLEGDELDRVAVGIALGLVLEFLDQPDQLAMGPGQIGSGRRHEAAGRRRQQGRRPIREHCREGAFLFAFEARAIATGGFLPLQHEHPF